MRDYYDRLEQQLSELTVRGAHRRPGVSFALPRVRVRAGVGNLVALGVSGLTVVAVVAAVLAAGAGRHHSRPVPVVGHAWPPVLRNVYPAPLPAAVGQPSFAGRLARTGRSSAASGEVRFYAVSSSISRMVLTAAGLRRVAAGEVYAVWLLPTHHPGTPATLLGVIEPSVGSSGHLTLASVLPQTVGGPSELVITVQPRSAIPAARSTDLQLPGPVVLQRFVDF